MCGIFGIFVAPESGVTAAQVQDLSSRLFVLSESRGKESSGICIRSLKDHRMSVLKHSLPATAFIKSDEYKSFYKNALQSSFEGEKLTSAFGLMAHARLVTNGTQENNNNNQPVIKNGTVAVHNGICTNVDQVWKQHSELERELEVDTEVMLALFRKGLNVAHQPVSALAEAFRELKGTFSTCIFPDRYSHAITFTNNGSLYYAELESGGVFVFASESFILSQALEESGWAALPGMSKVKWMQSGTGCLLELNKVKSSPFQLSDRETDFSLAPLNTPAEIVNASPDRKVDFKEVYHSLEIIRNSPLRKLLEFNESEVRALKRCTKCLLPETFPFIRYDAKGVCNYCDSYVIKSQGAKEKEFHELMAQYRSKDGKPDCIIPFSGGRDSSYGLHYIVHDLKMKPITYTYDWGMVTDLARRNIARVCGKLGVENIIVSADIRQKRENIRKNVEAWLKRPALGIIPLFMAGDKQFFSFVNMVKRQTGIKLDIWSTNQLENTDFKVGFCGVSPTFDKHRPDYLPMKSKMGMAMYYGMQFLKNPAYLNSSLFDTVKSFFAYYAEERTHFYQLFDWIKWDEKVIESTLINEYEWELAPDTTTSWRIGDGTAPFYNYIYFTVAGFSEFDTFRSNQIREGLITREEGLELIYKENLPRFESMHWYLETIGVDFERAVKAVNAIPKLYRK